MSHPFPGPVTEIGKGLFSSLSFELETGEIPHEYLQIFHTNTQTLAVHELGPQTRLSQVRLCPPARCCQAAEFLSPGSHYASVPLPALQLELILKLVW